MSDHENKPDPAGHREQYDHQLPFSSFSSAFPSSLMGAHLPGGHFSDFDRYSYMSFTECLQGSGTRDHYGALPRSFDNMIVSSFPSLPSNTINISPSDHEPAAGHDHLQVGDVAPDQSTGGGGGGGITDQYHGQEVMMEDPNSSVSSSSTEAAAAGEENSERSKKLEQSLHKESDDHSITTSDLKSKKL